MKSAWRHFFDWWSEHRGYGSRDGMEAALMGVLFNVMGYTHEYIKARLVAEDEDRRLSLRYGIVSREKNATVDCCGNIHYPLTTTTDGDDR